MQANTLQVRAAAKAVRKYNVFGSKRTGALRTLTLYAIGWPTADEQHADMERMQDILHKQGVTAHMRLVGDVIRVHCTLA